LTPDILFFGSEGKEKMRPRKEEKKRKRKKTRKRKRRQEKKRRRNEEIEEMEERWKEDERKGERSFVTFFFPPQKALSSPIWLPT